MGIKYIPVGDIPIPYEIPVSKAVLKVVEEQGLIEPLVRMPDGTIHWKHQEYMEAFRMLCSSDRTNVIVVDYNDLDANERAII